MVMARGLLHWIDELDRLQILRHVLLDILLNSSGEGDRGGGGGGGEAMGRDAYSPFCEARVWTGTPPPSDYNR